MFDNLPLAPPDAIFGLNEAIRSDPRRDKINLGAGVYKDENGQTPIFAAVKEAERRLLVDEATKSYLPIEGLPAFGAEVRRLVLGHDHPALAEDRAVTLQAPGGTGALRAAADFLRGQASGATVWLSDPTWPNHPQIFNTAGLPIERYPWFDTTTHGLAFDALCERLGKAQPGDVVVLHGCCHNPSGVDPSPEQWRQLAEVLAERRLLPLIDFAYQGFAHGVEEDATGLRAVAEAVPELLIASSYSKNFGLYRERIGALTAVTTAPEPAVAVLSQLKRSARALWSNPPAHGALLVSTVLADAELRSAWLEELTLMRRRIRDLRKDLAAGLDSRGVRLHPTGNDFLTHQNGMFSFTGLDEGQVMQAREEAAVYMVGSGRINVAGLSMATVGRVCDAISSVL